MHIKDDNEKSSHLHNEGEGGDLDTRTRSGDEGSIEMAPMQTPGRAWEKKTILKIDVRLLIIRGYFASLTASVCLYLRLVSTVGLCYAVSLM